MKCKRFFNFYIFFNAFVGPSLANLLVMCNRRSISTSLAVWRIHIIKSFEMAFLQIHFHSCWFYSIILFFSFSLSFDSASPELQLVFFVYALTPCVVHLKTQIGNRSENTSVLLILKKKSKTKKIKSKAVFCVELWSSIKTNTKYKLKIITLPCTEYKEVHAACKDWVRKTAREFDFCGRF